jgi:hypothetical protein
MVSCQKELSSEIPDNTVPPVNTAAPRLLKTLFLDTTLTAPFDTIRRESYFYDAQGRPVRIVHTKTDALGNVNYENTFRYIYNGTDTFASRTISTEPYYSTYPDGIIRDTTDYIFLNGRCIYDSSFLQISANGFSYVVHHYTYGPGDVISVSTKSKSTGSPEEISTRTIWPNIVNNLIMSVSDSSIAVSPVNGYSSANTSTFTYSDHPNPFVRFSNPMRTPYIFFDMGIGSREAAPDKLYLAQTYTLKEWEGYPLPLPGTMNVETNTVINNYQFRADGYPVIIWESVPAENRREKYVLVYE